MTTNHRLQTHSQRCTCAIRNVARNITIRLFHQDLG
uniref:Uncharacterized protein n=1 Tax=Anguilla anguilla TaxID=7936 RepID=A0A0E9UT88_ANGAN